MKQTTDLGRGWLMCRRSCYVNKCTNTKERRVRADSLNREHLRLSQLRAEAKKGM